jgi:hypothetical protein
MTRFRLFAIAAAALFAQRASAQSAPVRRVVEELRIDGNDHEWSRIDAIHVAKNGTIYVRQPGDFAMSIFSPKGQLVKQFARKGSGPGEVRFPSASGLVGDSLYISESGSRRLTLFGLDGTAGRVIKPVDSGDWIKGYAPAVNYTSRVFAPEHLVPNNAGIGSGLVDVRRIQNGLVKSLALLRMTWDGQVTGVVAEIPFGAHMLLVEVPGRSIAPGRQPFVANPLPIYSPSGDLAIVGAEELPTPAIVIRHISIMGDTTRVVRVPYTPRPVTSGMVDSAVVELAKSLKREGNEDFVRKAIVVPKYDWPIGQAVLADDGTTWVQIKGTRPLVDWLIISPQGKHIATVELPRAVNVMLLQNGIWAVSKDEDDVPSVVRYRLK